jgi:flagellar hook-basal body complex protein FliE
LDSPCYSLSAKVGKTLGLRHQKSSVAEDPSMDAISRLTLPLDISSLTGARAAKALGTGASSSSPADAVQGGGSFGTALQSALKSVSSAQNESSDMQQQVQLGNPSVSLEQTMVAIQKAQIGFQATVHVRNRMVQAYTDIMNMQV